MSLTDSDNRAQIAASFAFNNAIVQGWDIEAAEFIAAFEYDRVFDEQ